MNKEEKFEMYRHHGKYTIVRKDLKGKHREHCMCYECKFFCPENPDLNCGIASILFAINREFNIVTPVWECPDFAYKG